MRGSLSNDLLFGFVATSCAAITATFATGLTWTRSIATSMLLRQALEYGHTQRSPSTSLQPAERSSRLWAVADVHSLFEIVIVAAPWKEKCLSHLYNAHVDMQNTASITT